MNDMVFRSNHKQGKGSLLLLSVFDEKVKQRCCPGEYVGNLRAVNIRMCLT